jgi:outer membrane lipoprotein-sorting protein
MRRAKSFLSRCRRFTIILLAISFPAAVSAQEPLKEPRFYLERLLEYYRSIETISAEFSVVGQHGETSGTKVDKRNDDFTCRYYKKGDTYRQEIRHNGSAEKRPEVTIFQDGTAKRLYGPITDPPSLSIYSDREGGMAKSSTGYQAFFYQMDVLEMMFLRPEWVAGMEMSARHVEAGDSPIVEVALAITDQRGSRSLVLRVDPGRRFAPVYFAQDVVNPNETNHITYEVRDWLDARNGYFAPTEIVTTGHVEQGARLIESQQTIRITKVEFNGPVNDNLFELVPEPGTNVMDAIAGAYYVAGDQTRGLGNTIIEPAADQGEQTDQTPAAQLERKPAPAATPVATRTVPPTAVPVFAAVALLLLGCLAMWRLRRRKAEKPPETRP